MSYLEFMESARRFRSQHFRPIGKFLLKIKLTPNLLTLFSLLFGLLAVYFLFRNHLFFILFALLHLLADAFDGLLARLTQSTSFGKYFDYLTDRFIVFLLFLKVYFYLHDYYILLIVALFLLSHLVYLFSHFKYPLIFIRTSALFLLFFYPLFPATPYLTFCYLLGGIISLYNLLLQLRYFLRTRTAKN